VQNFPQNQKFPPPPAGNFFRFPQANFQKISPSAGGANGRFCTSGSASHFLFFSSISWLALVLQNVTKIQVKQK
jgi:hypothetical protein